MTDQIIPPPEAKAAEPPVPIPDETVAPPPGWAAKKDWKGALFQLGFQLGKPNPDALGSVMHRPQPPRYIVEIHWFASTLEVRQIGPRRVNPKDKIGPDVPVPLQAYLFAQAKITELMMWLRETLQSSSKAVKNASAPEAVEEPDVQTGLPPIIEDDLEVTRYHCNHESLAEPGRGCRIDHKPSGLSATSEDQTTFQGNRMKAMSELMERLVLASNQIAAIHAEPLQSTEELRTPLPGQPGGPRE